MRMVVPRCTIAAVRAILILLALATVTHADTSKLAKEDVPLQNKTILRGKNKLCCGYPLVDDLQWALRFYWLALEEDYQAREAMPRAGRGKDVPLKTWVEL